MTFDWTALAALAAAITAVAWIIGIALGLSLLHRRAEQQFVPATAATFAVWEDDDFQRAQQWILYELKEQTWREFVAAHRGGYGERAFIRVGSLYNRIGYLVAYDFLDRNDRIMLDTVGGLAIAVWQKIEPLVLEARLVENSTMFQDYQRMLPRCYECYVPTQPVPPLVRQGAAAQEER